MPTKSYTKPRNTVQRLVLVNYATERAAARANKYPGESGAKRLAEKLGCGHISIYDWERVGFEHLPKNRFIRKAYLKAIGLSESPVVAAEPTEAAVTK
jgi:hypothetical protein